MALVANKMKKATPCSKKKRVCASSLVCKAAVITIIKELMSSKLPTGNCKKAFFLCSRSRYSGRCSAGTQPIMGTVTKVFCQAQAIMHNATSRFNMRTVLNIRLSFLTKVILKGCKSPFFPPNESQELCTFTQ